MRAISEQEKFWQGDFGDEYVARNQGAPINTTNIAFFSKIFSHTQKIESVIEFGTNRGLNLIAINALLPACKMSGVEINAQAHAEAIKLGLADVALGSFIDYPVTQQYDLSFTKGVLIHIAPELLPTAYTKLYEASRQYILIAEYYNPSPVEISYRGHEGKLFKRDFAGEMLDRYPDLQLAAYGFCYRRDPVFPMDDANWFLLEKRA